MKLSIGDRVAYSVQFLRSIGMSHSDMARARGVVASIELLGSSTLASVDWGADASELPGRVNVANLAKVGANSRFCQC